MTHRRICLDGAILGIVCIAVTSSVIVHGAHSASPQSIPPDRPVSAFATNSVPKASASAALPLLAPAVQAIAPQTAAEATATPAPQPAIVDPASRLTSTASGVASTASAPTARLSRAQALPEVPLAPGGSNGSPAPATAGQNGATASAPAPKPVVANTLDAQYVEHTIVGGETLSGIAQNYGFSVSTIVANNPGLDDLDVIRPGQTLRIPTTNGLIYHVQAGDTLDDISRRYGVPLQDVLKLPANQLKDADVIKPGQTLLLPGDIKPPPPPPVIARALPAAPQVVLQPPSQPPANAAASAAAPAPAPASAPAPPPVASAVPVARFIWPIQGPITQGFGVPELGVGSPHTGVDIGLYGRDGSPIAAAAAGTVTFSGGQPCCGYGYYVIVKHAGGFETLYGHLSRRAVSVGDTVAQGQTVGYAGSTGFSTGTHLHFEIHLNGALQNPLRYLP